MSVFNGKDNSFSGDVKYNSGSFWDNISNWFTSLFNKEVQNVLDTVINDPIAQAQNTEAIEAAQTLASTITQYPFIKGASNQSALGKTIPYLLGKMYNTPYTLTDGFYSLSGDYGENQYFHGVFCCGFGKKKITEIMLGDDTILEDSDGLAEGEHTFTTPDGDSTSINTLELCQNGTEFSNDLYKYKVVATADGNEIKHEFGEDAEPLIRTLPDYTKKIEVCIQLPALRQYVTEDADGNTVEAYYDTRTLTVRPYWSNDDGATWNEFYFDGMTDNTISLNVNHTIRFVATKEFGAGDAYGKTIKIKVVKETAKLEQNSDESTYLAYYQAWCYDNKTSSLDGLNSCANVEDFIINNTVRFGVTVIANSNTNSQLDEFHTIEQMLARTWNGSGWTTEKSATSNPAAEILEILESSVHAPSVYTDDEIDLDSLGALYSYCDTNGYTTNALLLSGQKKSDLISNILKCCNAEMYISRENGKLTFVIDQKVTEPSGLINAENVINLSYSKDLSRKPTGVKVQYTSEESWQVDTFYAMLDGGEHTQDDEVTDLDLSYVTDYNAAYKLAQRKLRTMILQPRLFSATMGLEARKYKLFDTVYLQHPTFRQGLVSTTITQLYYTDNAITSLELSDYIQFESGKRYGILINAVSSVGSRIFKREITGTGKTRIVTLADSISGSILPQTFNLCSVGYLSDDGSFDSITNVMKITDIEPTTDGYSLTLKDYNEEMYEFGTIPEYKSNITRPPKASIEIPDPSLKGLNGASGYNTRTIELFIRSESQPVDLPFNFTQVFAHTTLDATTAQLNGWHLGRSAIREDDAPDWEIHQTGVSQADSYLFSASGWSTPVKVSQDVSVTQQQIQEMIDESTKRSGSPFVYSQKTYFPIGVDDNGVVLQDQTFSTTIKVMQSDEFLEYQFGEITGLPDGMTATHENETLTLTVAKGTVVTGGNIGIEINYYQYLSQNVYGDEDENYYVDEDGSYYGYYVKATTPTVYNLNIGYNQVKAARYLGAITALSELPDYIFTGDYFTWTGDDTESTKAESGTFLKGAVYTYNGTQWDKDTKPAHLTTALSDVIKDANAELASNNSEVVEFFKRIVSNEVVAANLTVTGSAFMNNVIANTVASKTLIAYGGTLLETAAEDATSKANAAQTAAEENASEDANEKATAAKLAAIEKTLEDLGFKDGDDVTIIDGGKIITSFIQTNEIVIGNLSGYSTLKGDVDSKASDQAAQDYANTARSNAAGDVYSAIGVGNYSDKTIISNGKLKTGLVDAEYVKAISGVFDNITVNAVGTFSGVVGNKIELVHYSTTESTAELSLSDGIYDVFLYCLDEYGAYTNLGSFICTYYHIDTLGCIKIDSSVYNEKVTVSGVNKSGSNASLYIKNLRISGVYVYAQYIKRA